MKRLTLSLVLILAATGCEKESVPVKEVIKPVKAMEIQDPAKLDLRVFTGRAEADQEVNLGFEVSGTIISRPASKGDFVKKGQLLAKLDPRDFQSEVDAAQAEFDRAEAYHSRIEQALKHKAVAEQDLTDAIARLEGAEANLRIKKKALDDSVMRAPYEGVIAWTFKERFQRIREKEVVLRLLDISKIKFTISIPESMISYAPLVEEVYLRFDAFPKQKITAVVKEIGTEATAATRTYPLTLLFEQPEEVKILPGMTGTTVGGIIRKPIGLEDMFNIPTAAVFPAEAADRNFVWVIDRSNMTVNLHEVEVDRTTPKGVRVKGLEPGMFIVTAGVFHLKEGQKVKVIMEER